MIAKELEKDGHYMSEHRIRRIMRENGFYPETRKNISQHIMVKQKAGIVKTL